MMKRLILIIIFLSLSFTLFAQNRKILTPDGKLHPINEVKRVKVSNKFNPQIVNYNFHSRIIDTLHYDPPWDTNFGYWGQDWMLQWFVCPADLTLLFAGFATADNPDAMSVELKIVKVNWTAEDLVTAGTLQHGWYEAAGNGFNDITAFLNNPDITDTDWISVDGGLPEPFGNDIWSISGLGFTIVPVADGATIYQWVDMDLLGRPTFLQGEVFGIAIKHTGPDMDANRILYWASGFNPVGAWKFYANGRTSGDLTTAGWWSREFHWNFAAVVDLGGPECRLFFSFTPLNTTLSTEPRTVATSIFGDHPFHPLDVKLYFSTDNGNNWSFNSMVYIGGDDYEGEIPGFPGGTKVVYYMTTIDTADPTCNHIVHQSLPTSYNIFQKENDILFIYNATDFSKGTATTFYIGDGTANPLDHDYWSIANDGVAELDVLLAFYDAVLEIGGAFPDADLSVSIATWIAKGTAENPKSYLQSSQDFGCFITGDFSDISFAPGDFMYDIMGVATLGPQDFSSGNNSDMQIVGVDADPVSGWVNDYAAANSVDFWYNPSAELGFTNWIDNIVPTSGATTIFTEPSTGNVVGVRNEGTGWKTAFLAYDYLGADFLADSSGPVDFNDPTYAWGVQVVSQAYAFFTWSGAVSVERENNLLPDEYSLSQNYPNPFNPSTTIKFSVPQQTNVVLKVYDILGSEVANLVNETLDAGNYTVNFDASQFASGMYIYKITAGNFVTTKKMVLLK